MAAHLRAANRGDIAVADGSEVAFEVHLDFSGQSKVRAAEGIKEIGTPARTAHLDAELAATIVAGIAVAGIQQQRQGKVVAARG
jgi:hypothetical protein